MTFRVICTRAAFELQRSWSFNSTIWAPSAETAATGARRVSESASARSAPYSHSVEIGKSDPASTFPSLCPVAGADVSYEVKTGMCLDKNPLADCRGSCAPAAPSSIRARFRPCDAATLKYFPPKCVLVCPLLNDRQSSSNMRRMDDRRCPSHLSVPCRSPPLDEEDERRRSNRRTDDDRLSVRHLAVIPNRNARGWNRLSHPATCRWLGIVGHQMSLILNRQAYLDRSTPRSDRP